MKLGTLPTLAVAAALTAFTVHAGSTDPGPGFIDLGKFSPPDDGGEFIEVQVKSSLINIAARLTEQVEPEVAKLLRGIKQVRVNVIGVTDKNSAELTRRAKEIREELESAGWDRVVTVREKNDDIGVYLKLRGEEAVEGIVVTVLDGKREAVFVNVVGDIRPEQIALVGKRLHIDPLEKLGEAIH